MATVAVSGPEIPVAEPRSWPPVLVIVSMAVVVFVLVCALAGDTGLLGDAQTQRLTLSAQPSSPDHVLGTDQLGRDIWGRLVAGTRPAVAGPGVIAVFTVLFGAALGMLAGLRGGLIDAVISRYVDMVIALPGLLLVIVIVGALGGGYGVTVAVFVFLLLPGAIRLTRSATLAQVRLPYLDAARTLGLSTSTVLRRYLLPNIFATVLATGLLDFVGALVAFSSLSYLGLGVSAGTPDWGRMLAEGRPLLLRNPWASVAPACAIVLIATAVTVLGDWFHERVADR